MQELVKRRIMQAYLEIIILLYMYCKVLYLAWLIGLLCLIISNFLPFDLLATMGYFLMFSMILNDFRLVDYFGLFQRNLMNIKKSIKK